MCILNITLAEKYIIINNYFITMRLCRGARRHHISRNRSNCKNAISCEYNKHICANISYKYMCYGPEREVAQHPRDSAAAAEEAYTRNVQQEHGRRN